MSFDWVLVSKHAEWQGTVAAGMMNELRRRVSIVSRAFNDICPSCVALYNQTILEAFDLGACARHPKAAFLFPTYTSQSETAATLLPRLTFIYSCHVQSLAGIYAFMLGHFSNQWSSTHSLA